MNFVGEEVGRIPRVGRSRAGASAPPQTRTGVDGLERVVGPREQREVRRRGGVRPVGAELRQPEPVRFGSLPTMMSSKVGSGLASDAV